MNMLHVVLMPASPTPVPVPPCPKHPEFYTSVSEDAVITSHLSFAILPAVSDATVISITLFMSYIQFFIYFSSRMVLCGIKMRNKLLHFICNLNYYWMLCFTFKTGGWAVWSINFWIRRKIVFLAIAFASVYSKWL